MKFTTRLLHDTFAPDAATGATTQPIYQSSAFYQPTAEEMERVFAGKKPGFVYTRVGNPTIAGFERRVNALEGGVGAVACASGMAAVSQAVLNILSQGAEILASGGLYGGTSSLFRDFAHAHGVPLFVDNTVTTPYLCQPLSLGADVVIHSTSKALNGNGNSIGGIVVSGGVFRYDAARYPKMKEYQFGPMSFLVRMRMRMVTDYGGCMAPFNAYLTGIGLDTLALRLDRICENALALARLCEAKGFDVNYPGLETSPYHEVAQRQFGGRYGAMMTLRLGTKERAYQFINHLHYALNVSNIGDARTLVLHPASTIFVHSSAEEKENGGVTDDLVRINVGIEDTDDLIEDFTGALAAL